MKCSDPNEGEAVMVGYRDFLPGQDKVPTWETEGAFQPPPPVQTWGEGLAPPVPPPTAALLVQVADLVSFHFPIHAVILLVVDGLECIIYHYGI